MVERNQGQCWPINPPFRVYYTSGLSTFIEKAGLQGVPQTVFANEQTLTDYYALRTY